MKSSDLYHPTLSFGLLLIGPAKTGKTITGLSFEDVYVADCDNNLSGAVRVHLKEDPNFKFLYDTINVADDSDLCKSWSLEPGQAVPADKRWTRLVECMKAAVKTPTVKALFVDSLSAVDQYLQDHIVANKTGDKEKQMTIGDWIPYKNMMTKFVTTFRSVNRIFIMSCHETAEKGEGDRVLQYKPAMNSALRDNFGGFFSDVWYTTYEKLGEAYNFYVKTMPQPQRSLGNSLGLPENYKFSWSDMKQRLDGNALPIIK